MHRKYIFKSLCRVELWVTDVNDSEIFLLWQNTYNIRFALLTIVGVSDINYIHSVVQPPPLAIPRTFSSPQTETLYTLNISSLFPLLQLLVWITDFSTFLMESTPRGGQTESASIFNLLSAAANAKCSAGGGGLCEGREVGMLLLLIKTDLSRKRLFPKKGTRIEGVGHIESLLAPSPVENPSVGIPCTLNKTESHSSAHLPLPACCSFPFSFNACPGSLDSERKAILAGSNCVQVSSVWMWRP